jgi:hypothetical protein
VTCRCLCSFLVVVVVQCLWIDDVQSRTSPFNRTTNDNPKVHLSLRPQSGFYTDNIEVRCQISPISSISPLTSTKFENVYLSVKTDNVKPSGILLMFDDTNDRCEINREKHVHIDVCNATLILIRMNHTKGSAQAISSYRILSE